MKKAKQKGSAENLEIEMYKDGLPTGETWIAKDVEIVGDLAIHETRKKNGWTITHVPTRLGFASIIPPDMVKSKPKLKKWAAAIQEKLKKDWLAMSRSNGADVMADPERTKGIRDRIREMAINTKV